MQTLKRLEKSRMFWCLLGIFLLFFILRLPSLIEPNWYGDEGIYQVIGQSLNKGHLLYAQIWDNKPPFLYLVYAFFRGEQFLVRLFSLLTGILTLLTFFHLSKLLFRQLTTSIITTLFFALLFATPLLEGNIANAENFMLLPIIASGYLIYKGSIKHKNGKPLTLFISGLFLGIAFLFKIVALFDFAAFILFFIFAGFLELKIRNHELWAAKRRLLSLLPNLLSIALGFLLPIAITFSFFIYKHALSTFVQAVFFSNVGYVGYGNKFIIPQGFLILKLALLATTSLVLFWKRKQITLPIMFISLWFAFSLFNTFFSGRPYIHYTLVILPSYCLLVGLFLESSKPKFRFAFLIIFLSTTMLLGSIFKPNVRKAILYYDNAFSFMTGDKVVNSYQSFFDQKTPRDYELASFIRTHTGPKDEIFVWGDSAQIYALSNKQPIGKYTVAYHITQYPDAFSQTQRAIDTVKPKYIITLNESKPIPFYLPTYRSKFVLKDAIIYERDF